jgi:hypothetical protein
MKAKVHNFSLLFCPHLTNDEKIGSLIFGAIAPRVNLFVSPFLWTE